MVSKYVHLMLPGAFLDKVTPDMEFKDGVAVQWDVPVVKILLQMMVIYKWLHKFNVNTYVLFLDPV